MGILVTGGTGNVGSEVVKAQDVLQQHGVYPAPIGGTSVSRVDVRDIADAAAIALTTSLGHATHRFDALARETAAAWR